MGLHISIYKVKNGKFSEQKWFDFLRHMGDKSFHLSNDFEPMKNDNEFYRPKNIDNCILWVRENIIPENKERLITALEKMKHDNDLYFSFST